jgi:hypothetical protein
MTKWRTALAILPPYLLYLLELLHYYIIARIYYISMPDAISFCVSSLVYHFSRFSKVKITLVQSLLMHGLVINSLASKRRGVHFFRV